jgi:hypothetical protein
MTTEQTREPDPITGFDFRVDEPVQPVKAIRKRCVDCVDGEIKRIPGCKFPPGSFNGCSLHPMRMGRRRKGISPMKSIRQHCLWCCKQQPNEVKLCPVYGCPLWPFRFGHNPKLTGRPPRNPQGFKKGHAGDGIEPRTEAG